MTFRQRILRGLSGVLLVLAALSLVFSGERGYYFMLLGLELILIGKAIEIQMARHMVGGIFYLYEALLLLDIGIFTLVLVDLPRGIAMLYLNGGVLLSGVTDLLRARDWKRMALRRWKFMMVIGVSKIIFVLTSLSYLHSPYMLTLIYAVGLAYSGVVRVVTSFQKVELMYVG